MKKKILRLTFGMIISGMLILPACDLIDDCGTCELVTEDASGNATYGPPTPFCGDNYWDKVNSSPTTIGGITTYWYCY